MAILIFILIIALLFWGGVNLNRWVNGSSRITRNQERIVEELRRNRERRSL